MFHSMCTKSFQSFLRQVQENELIYKKKVIVCGKQLWIHEKKEIAGRIENAQLKLNSWGDKAEIFIDTTQLQIHEFIDSLIMRRQFFSNFHSALFAVA